jgi:hypothetical protein
MRFANDSAILLRGVRKNYFLLGTQVNEKDFAPFERKSRLQSPTQRHTVQMQSDS